MAIIARRNGGNTTQIEEGNYLATCIWVIDLGEQWSEKFNKTSHKVMITWEIPDVTITVDGEEKPKVISKEYGLSLSEKSTLRPHLEAWRGKRFTEEELKGFDLKAILGKSCQLQILHNDKGYANVGSIMALTRGMTPPPIYNDTVYFDLNDPACMDLMQKLPPWIIDKVKQSETYKELTNAMVDKADDEFSECDLSEPLLF